MFPVDIRHVSYMTYWGLLIGPLNHYYQNAMARYGPSNFLVKIPIDHAFFRCPIILAFATYLRVMKGEALTPAFRNGWTSCRQLWIDATRVWPLIQALNFTVIPLQFRVLYGNVALFFWATYMALRLKREEKAKQQAAN
eukprot:GEMP01111008.1.p2 GENE.GEMP01111008.1~~GEMP01111008.1.p2  ORF type:complete len:139 (+),score=22.37 GEMP01111008.1:31-447(+)